jgi:hypothetical protein
MNIAIKRKKHILGLFYGLFGGAAFSVTAWGYDGWLLSHAHAAFPWLNFITSLVICIIVAALAGWLTARLDSSMIGILLWMSVACLFAWLTVWIPLHLTPYFMRLIDPGLRGWLEFPYYSSMKLLMGIALIAIGIAAVFIGALESTLIEQSLFSSAPIAVLVPVLVCIFLFSISGIATDYLVNQPFRESLQVIDNIIQFTLDNEGKEIDRATARVMHLGAIGAVRDLIHKPRRLIIGDFTETVDRVDILVDFDGQWVNCVTVSAQAAFCKKVSSPP